MAIKEDCYWYDYEQRMGARLSFCKLQKGFKPLQSCEGCNQYHSKYKRTHADNLRAKSDEGLADWFVEQSPGICPGGRLYDEDHCTQTTCFNCWLDWLKQEANNG